MQGIIFDLDDTLVYSVTAHMLSIKDVLNDYGLKMKWEDIRRRFGKRFIQIIRELYNITDQNILKEMERKKRNYFRKYLNFVIPMAGAKEILEYVKSLNIKIALATMSSRSEVNLILEKFGWSKYFDVIVTGEGLPSRPDPTLLRVTINKMRVLPTEVVSIGDSVYDIQAAHSIGVKFIGVATGAFDKVDLERAGADYVVNDLFGAIEILTWLKAQENKLPSIT